MAAAIFQRISRIITNRLGQAVEYRPGGVAADAVQIKAVFNAAYASADINGVPVEGAAPTAWVSLADIDPQTDDTLVAEGVEYLVVGREPDGSGMIRLRLEVA